MIQKRTMIYTNTKLHLFYKQPHNTTQTTQVDFWKTENNCQAEFGDFTKQLYSPFDKNKQHCWLISVKGAELFRKKVYPMLM